MEWQVIGSVIASTGIMQIIISLASKQLTENKITKDFRCGHHEQMEREVVIFCTEFKAFKKDMDEVRQRLSSFDTEVFARLNKIETNLLLLFKEKSESIIPEELKKKINLQHL